MKPVLFIENWGLVSEDDPYKAPEIRRRCLTGNIISEGKMRKNMHTSPIVKYDLSNLESPRVETQNTIYILGFPNPEFVKMLLEKPYKNQTFIRDMSSAGFMPENGWYRCKPPRDDEFIGYGVIAGEINRFDFGKKTMSFVKYYQAKDYPVFNYVLTQTDPHTAWMKVECWQHMPDLPV